MTAGVVNGFRSGATSLGMSFALKRGWRFAAVFARPASGLNFLWHPWVPVGVLAEIVGPKPIMSWEVENAIRRYAKAHDLLITPGDKISCDAKLKELFNGAEIVELRTAQKYFKKHLIQPEEVDEKAVDQDMDLEGSTSTHDNVWQSRATKPNPAPKKRTTGYQKQLQLSLELAAICGAQQLSRGQIMRAVWDYAKQNNLKRKNYIMCDEKLKRFAGVEEFRANQLMRLISPHVSNIE